MTETELIISEMSQITIGNDLLKQVDIQGLFKNFNDDYNSLGEFQKTRDAYEKRGTRKKIVDFFTFDKTMENAQLSATEIQANFSKSLGELMIISVVQSQSLQQQQEQLAKQQGIIKNQTEQTEIHTHELEKQHEVLAKQSDELNTLLNNFLTFKGLTSERIDQLSSIVQSMESIRDSLLNAVDDKIKESHVWVSKQQEKTLIDISSQTSVLEEYVKQNIDDIVNRCQTVESENNALTQKLSEINTIFSKKYEEMTVAFSTEREKLNTHSTHTEKSLTDVTNNFNDIHEEFKLYRENQHKATKKLVILFSIFAVVSFASTAYLFFK